MGTGTTPIIIPVRDLLQFYERTFFRKAIQSGTDMSLQSGGDFADFLFFSTTGHTSEFWSGQRRKKSRYITVQKVGVVFSRWAVWKSGSRAFKNSNWSGVAQLGGGIYE